MRPIPVSARGEGDGREERGCASMAPAAMFSPDLAGTFWIPLPVDRLHRTCGLRAVSGMARRHWRTLIPIQKEREKEGRAGLSGPSSLPPRPADSGLESAAPSPPRVRSSPRRPPAQSGEPRTHFRARRAPRRAAPGAPDVATPEGAPLWSGTGFGRLLCFPTWTCFHAIHKCQRPNHPESLTSNNKVCPFPVRS